MAGRVPEAGGHAAVPSGARTLCARCLREDRYFRGAELLFQDVIECDLFAQVDRAIDLLYFQVFAGAGFLRPQLSRGDLSRAARRDARGGDQRGNPSRLCRSRAHSDPVYDERIVLWNPAHLPADWSVERLTEEHASIPYNPGIAYAFFRAGMIEAWGRGIWRITTACETAGNPTPEWRIEPGTGLWLEFRYSAAYQAADSRARDVGNGTLPPGAKPRWQPEMPLCCEHVSMEKSRAMNC